MTRYWDIFYLGPTDTLSTMEWKNLVYWDFIFHLSPTEPSIKLKKIIIWDRQNCTILSILNDRKDS